MSLIAPSGEYNITPFVHVLYLSPPPLQIRQLLKIELIQIWFKKVRHCFILYIVFKDAFTPVSQHEYTQFTNHLSYKLSK